MIIESIVTSMAPDGAINFAPMGVEWSEDALVLKPFLETTTFRNVSGSGVAVVNLTDDVMLFALAAISSPQFPSFPADVVRGVVLEAAILATRTHLIPADQIREEFAKLQTIVDKTAGPREQEAMALLTEHVRGR